MLRSSLLPLLDKQTCSLLCVYDCPMSQGSGFTCEEVGKQWHKKK